MLIEKGKFNGGLAEVFIQKACQISIDYGILVEPMVLAEDKKINILSLKEIIYLDVVTRIYFLCNGEEFESFNALSAFMKGNVE